MAERSMFWDNGVGDGGPYDQDELRILMKILRSSSGASRGVVGAYLNSIRPTSPGDNQVRADTGAAVVDGTLYEVDASVTANTSAPVSGATGKRLVLRKSWAVRTVRATVIASADGTAALPALTQVNGTTWDIPLASFVHQVSGAITSLTDEREFTNYVDIPFGFDGGGVAIPTGKIVPMRVPCDIHLIGYDFLGDPSGSMVVDVWKDVYGNWPPTVADTICGADKPTIAAGVKSQNNNIACQSNWTLNLARGDILLANVDSVTTMAQAGLFLRGARQ